MKTRVFIAGALALATLATAANALTVQNEDASAYKVSVKPKAGKAEEVDVNAKASFDVKCDKGCTIMLDGKSLNVDGKTAKVMIKDGHLVAG
jgi:hypothetical protein